MYRIETFIYRKIDVTSSNALEHDLTDILRFNNVINKIYMAGAEPNVTDKVRLFYSYTYRQAVELFVKNIGKSRKYKLERPIISLDTER